MYIYIHLQDSQVGLIFRSALPEELEEENGAPPLW